MGLINTDTLIQTLYDHFSDEGVIAVELGAYWHHREVEDVINAQPEVIIRCKDCKYCKHWYADKGRCFLWHETGIDVFEDGFCNYAERKIE